MLWCTSGINLGPLLFVLYTSSLADLLEAHDVSYNFYVDNTQIYVEMDSAVYVKEEVLSLPHDIKIWMSCRKSKLSNGKQMLSLGQSLSDQPVPNILISRILL